jgi:cytochrome c-type biogenesis protein CcmH/NrfG
MRRSGARRASPPGRSIMTAPTTRPDSEQQALLARLGLDDRATPEDVEITHDELVAFLTTAPRSLRAWARTQAEAADEAFALLTDPDAPGIPRALSGSTGRPTVQPDGPATPPARRAPSPAPAAVAAAALIEDEAIDDETAEDDDVTFEELLAEVTPGTHRESLAPKASKQAKPSKGKAVAAASLPAAALAADQPTGGSRVKRLGMFGAVAVAAVVVAAGVYQLGAASASPGATQPAASEQPQASAGIDQARVSDLMAKVQADPTDSESMMQLGDIFYVAGDFGAAATWFGKAYDVDPTDSEAQLALGAALFNGGDMDGAETAWIAVVEREPDNLEAHYDLGFLYLNREPPDMAGVQREWGKVIELAPDSDVAQTVKSHLDALASPEPSAAPSASPEGSVEP